MEESIDVTGIPGPGQVPGCGLILFIICTVVVMVISISVYLLFKINVMLLILLHGILAIVFGIIICNMLKSRKSW